MVWRLLRTLGFAVLFLAAVAGWVSLAEPPAARGAEALAEGERLPSLAIDFGDGSQRRYSSLALPDQGTVLDLLTLAAAHPRGISFRHRGSGETAFVTEIDGLKNEGGGKRNWRFSVNGKWADHGCGVYRLAPGDAVLWKFDLGQ